MREFRAVENLSVALPAALHGGLPGLPAVHFAVSESLELSECKHPLLFSP
jgi:hypothetical protein